MSTQYALWLEVVGRTIGNGSTVQKMIVASPQNGRKMTQRTIGNGSAVQKMIMALPQNGRRMTQRITLQRLSELPLIMYMRRCPSDYPHTKQSHPYSRTMTTPTILQWIMLSRPSSVIHMKQPADRSWPPIVKMPSTPSWQHVCVGGSLHHGTQGPPRC